MSWREGAMVLSMVTMAAKGRLAGADDGNARISRNGREIWVAKRVPQHGRLGFGVKMGGREGARRRRVGAP